MRKVSAEKISEAIGLMCSEANFCLPETVWRALKKAYHNEEKEIAKDVLAQILENAQVASTLGIALCQDTGIAEVFIRIGQEVQITGGSLEEAVNIGIAAGYEKNYLRKSVLNDPFERKNTGDNTPAFIYMDIVPGNRLDITLLPKGGGTENASALSMMIPSDGWDAVKKFVVETVKEKGINSCPPLVVGVGIGGSFSTSGLLSKKALLRDIGSRHESRFYREREVELLQAVNSLGLGPMGLGGKTTALAVFIESAPCHIASLPVSVNLQCHSFRKAEVSL
jgi:fumarate hydratase subunit alpha